MKLVAIALCVLGLLGGCQRDAGGAAQAPKAPAARKAPAAVQRGPSAQQQTEGMVEAATQGRSQVPVDLKFELGQRPVRGRPLEIAFALLPGAPAESAAVEAAGSAGLPVSPDQARIEFPGIEPGQVYRGSVKLTPEGEGVLLLTLSVSLKRAEFTELRVFSVPLIVAPAPALEAEKAGEGS